MSERATNRLLAWTTARRPAFPEATAWDWGLYRVAKYLLILRRPPLQRESEKGYSMDVDGKISEGYELNDKEIELQKDSERACERNG